MDPTLATNPPFFDLVGQVRAMRRLEPDPLPLELRAPSGMNTQPWSFVVLHDDPGDRSE